MRWPNRNATLAAGKYELIEEIGRGGMGSVWRAHALLLDRPCAIKFLTPDAAEDPASRERFVHEARAAARLRSPHAVTIFDVDFSDGMPFIAMELLSGESLEHRLKRGVLSPRLTCQLVHQVALGLSHAHAANLVHRDLKPDNIFVVEENPLLAKLVDFGIAKDVNSSRGFRTATGMIIGTANYMSPEQALGHSIDSRCDVWALGVVTYRCLTGRLPFTGDSWPEVLFKIVHGELPPLTSPQVALPRSADRWWKRVMQRDPAARPASALMLAAELEQALLGTRSEPSAASGPGESAIRQRRSEFESLGRPRPRPWLWALGLLGLCAAAGGAWLYMARGLSPWAALAKQTSSQPARSDPATAVTRRRGPVSAVAGAPGIVEPAATDVPRGLSLEGDQVRTMPAARAAAEPPVPADLERVQNGRSGSSTRRSRSNTAQPRRDPLGRRHAAKPAEAPAPENAESSKPRPDLDLQLGF